MHGQIKFNKSSTPPPEVGDGIELRSVVDFLKRNLSLIAFTTVVVFGLGLGLIFIITPRYTATVQVLLEPRKEKIFGAEGILPELNLDTANVDSQISVIQSISLLQRVVAKYDLTKDVEFGTEKTGLIAAIKSRLFPPEREVLSDSPDAVPLPVLRTIENIREALDVTRVARQYVISIALTSQDPDKAVKLANAIGDAFVVDQLDARYEAAKRASSWLSERMEGLRDQVRASEEAVAKFRRDNGLETTSSESKITVSEQQLAEINEKLVTARADVAEKKAKFDQTGSLQANGGNLQAIPDVVRSLVISDLRKQEAEVTRKEADLVARYSDQHPTVVNARAERRDIERNIRAEVNRIIANIKNDYDVAAAREASLQASLDRLTGKAGAGESDALIKLRELERTKEANTTLYENFLSRAKITQEQSNFEEREARIISPAVRPKDPSFPKKIIFIPLAFIVGLGFGLGGAVAMELLSSGFATPKELESKLGRPVLAVVPLLGQKDRKVDGKLLDPINFLVAKPLSRFAESLRAIRIGVQMADVDQPAKIVVVTSSVPKEGKSTLAACLAFSAARAGLQVILIDGDLRHPSTSKYFALDSRAGLVDLLTGAATYETSIVLNGSLAILPAGSKSQNPSDLLGSTRMKHIVQHLAEVYDYVIIDSPPVAPVVDARILAALADKIVYVVRWQETARDLVTSCIQQLAADGKIAGLALNMVNESKTANYGAYSHYSGKSYSSYYQQ